MKLPEIPPVELVLRELLGVLVESPFTVIVNAEAVSLAPNPAPETLTD